MSAPRPVRRVVALEVDTHETRLFAGLCLTCNNASDCAYRDRRGIDAVFCEEYDGSAPAPENGIVFYAARPDTVLARGEGRRPKETRVVGLCVNCAHRDACSLPAAETGVWHCEEYE